MSAEIFVIGVADLRDYMMVEFLDEAWSHCVFLCYAVDAYAVLNGVKSIGDYESVVLDTMSGWMGRELVSNRNGIEDCFTEAERRRFVQRGVHFCHTKYAYEAVPENKPLIWNVMLRIGMLCEVLDQNPDAEFVFSVEE